MGGRRLDWEKILKNKELLRLSAGATDQKGRNLFHKCAYSCPENLPELIKNYPKKFLKKDLNAKENSIKFTPAKYIFQIYRWLKPDVIIPALKAMIDAGYVLEEALIDQVIHYYEWQLYTNVNQDVITLLIKKGIGLNKRIYTGDVYKGMALGKKGIMLHRHTVLWWLKWSKNDGLVLLALKYGADANDGLSLLKAIEKRDWSFVKLLVEHGADPWKKLGEDFVHSYEKDRDFWINMTAFAFLDKILEDSQKSGDVDSDLLEIILHLLQVGLEKKEVITKNDLDTLSAVKSLILKVMNIKYASESSQKSSDYWIMRLLYAVMNQDGEAVKKIIDRDNVGARQKTIFGVSPLQMAQRAYRVDKDKKNWDILLLLMGKKEDLSDIRNMVILLLNADFDMQEELSESGLDVSNMVKSLILKVMNIKYASESSQKSSDYWIMRLLYAVMNQDGEAVKKIMDRGDVDARQKTMFGVSPLQMAQRAYHEDKDKKNWDMLHILVGETKKDLSEYEIKEYETDQEKQTNAVVERSGVAIRFISKFLSLIKWDNKEES